MSAPGTTPAPWTFHEPFAGFSKISGPDGELIFGIAAGSEDEKRPDDVCEANAHLIAASPAMYDALEGFIAYLDKGEGYLSHQLEYAMRDALALARGEQST